MIFLLTRFPARGHAARMMEAGSRAQTAPTGALRQYTPPSPKPREVQRSSNSTPGSKEGQRPSTVQQSTGVARQLAQMWVPEARKAWLSDTPTQRMVWAEAGMHRNGYNPPAKTERGGRWPPKRSNPGWASGGTGKTLTLRENKLRLHHKHLIDSQGRPAQASQFVLCGSNVFS